MSTEYWSPTNCEYCGIEFRIMHFCHESPVNAQVNQARREDFILKYMRAKSANWYVDVLNEDFHEQYHRSFPKYKRTEKMFGAQPVNQAMKDLARMASCGILNARRMGVSCGGEGFPTSIISYELPKCRR